MHVLSIVVCHADFATKIYIAVLASHQGSDCTARQAVPLSYKQTEQSAARLYITRSLLNQVSRNANSTPSVRETKVRRHLLHLPSTSAVPAAVFRAALGPPGPCSRRRSSAVARHPRSSGGCNQGGLALGQHSVVQKVSVSKIVLPRMESEPVFQRGQETW